ncbi:tetratricopeptide repeat-containing diguanylate cyclase [Shewanella donghaensis]|uniref:tetratricopeptide repeat-containing diguanylate cyclase n=1 Tax=Shewanella donghaensis TaxID=238836 RepID=UPI001182E606|nr:GGDEF domain-containing protein [Shewanella donghaensis]
MSVSHCCNNAFRLLFINFLMICTLYSIVSFANADMVEPLPNLVVQDVAINSVAIKNMAVKSEAVKNTDSYKPLIGKIKLDLKQFDHAQDKLDYLQQQQLLARLSKLEQAELWNLIAIEQEALDQLNKAILSYTEAINIAETEPISDILVISYIERSFIKYLQSNDTSQYCPDRDIALDLARQIDSPKVLAKALTQSAFCYADTNVFEKGLQRLEEALIIAKHNDFTPNKLAMIYNSTGAIYRSNGLHKYAYEYFNEAYKLWGTVNDIKDMFNMQHNMAGSSANMSDWDAAQVHISILFELAKQNPNFKDFMFFAEFNAGKVNFFQQKYDVAIDHLTAATRLQNTTNEKFFVGTAYGFLALSYMQQQQTELAFEAASQFLHSAAFESSSPFLKTSILALEKFSTQDYLESFNVLLSSVNHERETYASAMDKDVIYSSLEHSAKVSEYEIQILENQLSINILNLKSETDKQRISKLSLIVTSLIIAVLLVITAFLIQSRRFFKRRSQTDYLTGIANRRYTMEQGDIIFAAAKKKNQSCAVIIFDIDKFKRINDTYGHSIGDLAIKYTARKAKNWVKKSDILGRIGGEEFLVILPKTDLDTALDIAERLRESIEQQTFQFDDVNIQFTISLGVAVIDSDSSSLDQLVQKADNALYKAKNNGRNQVVSI